MAEVKDEITELKTIAVEHRTRLENGVKVFGAHNKRMEVLEERTTPRAPSVIRIVAATFGVFVTLSAALWGLSEKLSDRPTTEQMQQILQKSTNYHEQAGHKMVRDDVRAIQVEQVQQRHLIEDVQLVQKSQGEKLDIVLERLPVPRRPRR